MNKPLRVIYVPGLGDARVGGQLKAVGTWRWYGVEAELFQMKWADGEAWSAKFKRLLARIDTLVGEGNAVGLVGASAGGSAVINAYAARKDAVVGVVCISGKINRPQVIAQHYRDENPAFVTSMQACQSALSSLEMSDRRRILSRFGIADFVVPANDSRIPGAKNHYAPTVGHVLNIAVQITLGAPSFIRFLKKLTKKS